MVTVGNRQRKQLANFDINLMSDRDEQEADRSQGWLEYW